MAFLLYDMMTVAAGLKMMVHVQLFTPPPIYFREWYPLQLFSMNMLIYRKKTWITLVLFRYLVLFFTDRCPWPLEAQDEVEKIQNMLIKALEKLVAETNQRSGGGRFAKLMDVFVRMRGMYKAYEDIVKVMSKDDFLIECIPEILFYL